MKPKATNSVLIIAMITSLVIGLMHIGFIIQNYLKSVHRLPIKVDWNNADSITIWAQNQLLHFTYQMLFYSGMVNLCVGILIWTYIRKEKNRKESHEPDA
jgi:Na+-transporting NADH:ubiquinone oxidoreductase subunit NqrF